MKPIKKQLPGKSGTLLLAQLFVLLVGVTLATVLMLLWPFKMLEQSNLSLERTLTLQMIQMIQKIQMIPMLQMIQMIQMIQLIKIIPMIQLIQKVQKVQQLQNYKNIEPIET